LSRIVAIAMILAIMKVGNGDTENNSFRVVYLSSVCD